ncbi:gliding motility protein GldO [Bacteroidia bacterium]|nr:gliding motility protein GldO [Bacteroidia bacterium]
MKNRLISLVMLIVAISYSAVLRAQEEVLQQEEDQTEKTPTNLEEKTNLVTDGILQKQAIVSREPIAYPKIREADVIWSKRIWRVIDLHERINLPLYYPTEELTLRQSLAQTVILAIRNGEIRAYDPDEDDEFTTQLSADDISKRFDAIDRTEKRQKMDGTGDTTVTIRGSYDWNQVLEILVKEDWFFDKHYSKLFVRIVGICPVRVYPKELKEAPANGEENTEEEATELVKKQLFWLNYDEIRTVLARTPAYMPNNDATVLSYDDIFNMRKFSSYITKESNPHNNRSISTYTSTGYEALMESERIKSSIINWEHDLWEY